MDLLQPMRSGPPMTGIFERLVAPLLRRVRFPRARNLGAEGEALAARYLEQQGYRIEARNFRVRGGEADLVATKAGLVVVVEVKSRQSQRFGSPAQAVDRRKARRVLRAGRAYCRSRGISLQHLRCDVVAVTVSDAGTPEIRHYPAAFSEEFCR